MANIFSGMPEQLDQERFETLMHSGEVRIERILSHGHSSPPQGWYDQSEHEWILVLEGAGTLLFAEGGEVQLQKGDYLNIPAHTRHKVIWTDPGAVTLWLAVFYSGQPAVTPPPF